MRLPKKKATGKTLMSKSQMKDSAYYINKDGKYPFAIMLPATTGTEPGRFLSGKGNRTSTWSVDFAKWVGSNGATNNDWCLGAELSTAGLVVLTLYPHT